MLLNKRERERGERERDVRRGKLRMGWRKEVNISVKHINKREIHGRNKK